MEFFQLMKEASEEAGLELTEVQQILQFLCLREVAELLQRVHTANKQRRDIVVDTIKQIGRQQS